MDHFFFLFIHLEHGRPWIGLHVTAPTPTKLTFYYYYYQITDQTVHFVGKIVFVYLELDSVILLIGYGRCLFIHYHLLLIPLAEVIQTNNYHYLHTSCTVVLFKAASVRVCTCVCLFVRSWKKLQSKIDV